MQSRYYDPATGRFINADDGSILGIGMNVIGGTNLFSYCLNNPVMDRDDSGEIPQVLVGAVIGAFMQGGINLIGQMIANGGDFSKVDWVEFGIEFATGAAYGALVSSGLGAVCMIGGKMTIAGTRSVAHGINQGNTWGQIAINATGSMAVAGVFACRTSMINFSNQYVKTGVFDATHTYYASSKVISGVSAGKAIYYKLWEYIK